MCVFEVCRAAGFVFVDSSRCVMKFRCPPLFRTRVTRGTEELPDARGGWRNVWITITGGFAHDITHPLPPRLTDALRLLQDMPPPFV